MVKLSKIICTNPLFFVSLQKKLIMTFKEIQEILQNNSFYGHTVHKHKNGYNLSYVFRNISYYTVPIIVDVLKANQEKIVIKVKIANIEINDEKELIPTLNGISKIHHNILYRGKTKK